jgi:hypothetical protein
VSPPGIDSEHHIEEEAESILLLRVGLLLLGEARLRGDFGDEAELAQRAAALAAELTGGAPSPDPQRAAVEVELLRPDRISLAAPFREGGATTWSLMLDGTLFDGGTAGSMTAVAIDPQELSVEERADLERHQEEWRAHHERATQFTATRFVRAIAAPPQRGAEVRVLAIMLYEDGFYVEHTYDSEPTALFDLHLTAEQFFARHLEAEPEIEVEDDVGTEYFVSGGGGGGGVAVSHSSRGFAPAPSTGARVLRITAGGTTVELDLHS